MSKTNETPIRTANALTTVKSTNDLSTVNENFFEFIDLPSLILPGFQPSKSVSPEGRVTVLKIKLFIMRWLLFDSSLPPGRDSPERL